MCGRYVITKPNSKTIDIVKKNIKVDDTNNYNAHPSQNLPIIKSYSNGKTLESYEWGLIPSWSKKLNKFSPLINARVETLMEKVTFKNLIQTSRCVVPADGYYEWSRKDKIKIPFYFTREDKALMFFAAIYQNNRFCIITKEASSKICEIHHREPLIINLSQIANYLNIKKEASDILSSIKQPELKFYEISKDVNKPTINDPNLIKKIIN